MTELEETRAAYRSVWSLFTALEHEDYPMVNAIVDETTDDRLLEGWHLVACHLRLALQHHAEHLRCDCGSLEWLEPERPSLAAQGDE